MEHETREEHEERGHSRRELLVKGGLITAGAAFLGSPADETHCNRLQ